MSEWKTIDSAPKDETVVWLWDGSARCLGHWQDNIGLPGSWHSLAETYRWGDARRGGESVQLIRRPGFCPTHWAPLPEPPK